MGVGGRCRFHHCTHFLDEEIEAHSGQVRGSSLSCLMTSSHDPAGFPSHCAPLPQPIPFLSALLKLFWTPRSHADLAQCQDTVLLHSPFTIGQYELRVLLDRQYLVMESSVTWRRGSQAVTHFLLPLLPALSMLPALYPLSRPAFLDRQASVWDQLSTPRPEKSP